jgi:hypothetical protein
MGDRVTRVQVVAGVVVVAGLFWWWAGVWGLA